VVERVPLDTAAVEVTHSYIIKYIMQSSFELYMHEWFATAAGLVGTPSANLQGPEILMHVILGDCRILWAKCEQAVHVFYLLKREWGIKSYSGLTSVDHCVSITSQPFLPGPVCCSLVWSSARLIPSHGRSSLTHFFRHHTLCHRIQVQTVSVWNQV